MEWFYWALATAAFYGLDGVASKYLVGRHIQSSIAFVMLLGLMDGFLAAYSYSTGVRLALSWPYFVLLAYGVLAFVGRIFFFEAMKHEEASRISAMGLAGPLATTVLAYFLLGEAFPPHIYLGVLLIVSGGVLITYRKVRRPEHHKGMWFTLAAVFAYALANICAKYSTPLGFWHVVFGGTAGYVACALLLFASSRARRAFRATFNQPKQYLRVAFLYLIMIAGWFLYIPAFTAGPISLVSAVTSTSALFTLAYAVVLSLFWPKILKEEIDKKTLGQKLLALVFMVWGVYLLA